MENKTNRTSHSLVATIMTRQLAGDLGVTLFKVRFTTAAKCLKVVVLLFKNDLNRDRVVGKLSELKHFFIDVVTFDI